MARLFSIDIDSQFQIKMAELANRMTDEIKGRIEQLPRELAQASYYKAIELANQKLHTTAQDYIGGLDYEEVAPGVWSVYLREDVAYLETGYERFDQKPGLLRNATKVSKSGYKYRVIPFKHGEGNSSGDMLSDLKRLRAGFDGFRGLNKDVDGNPLTGKMFTVTRNDVGVFSLNPKAPGIEAQQARFGAPDISPNLVGITKYQSKFKGRSGKERVKSSLVTFRVVSADPKYAEKWWHPGFGGAKIFDELPGWAQQQLDEMLKNILG